MLLAAVLLRLPRLTLLGLLGGLLAAGVHLVHPLLPASIVLLAHLLHHLLTLLAAILLLRPLLPDLAAAAPILALRGTGLAHLAASSTAAVASFLALYLLASASSSPLGRRSASVAPSITTAASAALSLAEGVALCSDHDREHGERGENEII